MCECVCVGANVCGELVCTACLRLSVMLSKIYICMSLVFCISFISSFWLFAHHFDFFYICCVFGLQSYCDFKCIKCMHMPSGILHKYIVDRFLAVTCATASNVISLAFGIIRGGLF